MPGYARSKTAIECVARRGRRHGASGRWVIVVNSDEQCVAGGAILSAQANGGGSYQQQSADCVQAGANAKTMIFVSKHEEPPSWTRKNQNSIRRRGLEANSSAARMGLQRTRRELLRDAAIANRARESIFLVQANECRPGRKNIGRGGIY